MRTTTATPAWGHGPWEEQHHPLQPPHGPPLPGRLPLHPVLAELRRQLGYDPSALDMARLHVGIKGCSGSLACTSRCWWSRTTWNRYAKDGLPERYAERVAFALGTWASELWAGQ